MMQDSYTIWVCQDCMLHHANGECGDCHTDEGHDSEPLSGIDYANGESITAGLLYREHAKDCPKYRYASLAGAYDCDCETMDFSWSSCEGCGSTLGGERHAMTLWFKD